MPRDPRLPVFTIPFALGALFHESHFTQVLEGPPGVLVAAAAVLSLVGPGSVRRLGILCAAVVFEAAHAAPWIANHQLFMAASALAILSTALARAGWAITRPVAGPVDPEGERAEPFLTLDDLRSALGLALPVLYAWTCFHKLNADFLAPETSSAARLCDQVLSRLRLGPVSPPLTEALHALAIHGTLVVEGVLAVGILVPRTRLFAVALALGFHLLTAAAGVEDFSAIAMGLLPIYLPDALLDRVRLRADALLARTPLGSASLRRALDVICLASAASVLLARPWWSDGGLTLVFEPWLRGATFVSRAGGMLFPLYALAAAALLAVARRDLGARAVASARVAPRGPAGVALSLFLLLDGAAPYLGVKTLTSFNMFSDLRTEGGATNHLLVRRPLDLHGHQTDLVRVLRSDDAALAALARSGASIPWFEVRSYASRRIARGEGGFSFAYARGGVVRSVARASDEPDLARLDPWIVRKLVTFGPVPERHVQRALAAR